MSLRKLYEHFQGIKELPVEIPDIRDVIYKLGIQDEIIFRPEPLNPGELRGIFYQYTYRPRPYADPELRTIIVYPENAPPFVQRLICAKELIHVMDSAVEQVSTEEEVRQLVDKLLGPLSTEDFGISDLVAAQDKMAIYRCIPLVFPACARAEAVEAMKAGLTIEQVAERAALPAWVAQLVMDQAWPELEAQFLDC
jgi:hypothetical protein